MVILWGYDAEDIMRSYGVIIAMMDRWEILEVHGGLCLRAENRTSKMQVFDVSHMGGFGGVGGVITFLASVSR